MKQFYVLEMNNFTEEEAQVFLSEAFAMEFGDGQGVFVSHLNEKGVSDLKQYVFKEDF